MPTMNTIHYQLQPSDLWVQQIHANLPSTLEGTVLTIDPECGQGKIEVVEIQPGLFVTLINVSLNASLKLVRIPKSVNDYFILNFYYSKVAFEQEAASSTRNMGLDHHSVLLSSATAGASMTIPATASIQVFNITFSKEWLGQFVRNNDSSIEALLSGDKPVYWYENLDYRIYQYISSIQSRSHSQNKMGLFADTLQVLSGFFAKIEKRSGQSDQVSLNPVDLQRLMQVRSFLESKWDTEILNEDLARHAGMSLSKFKRLFKQVFGISPYQYLLRYKMDKAIELLKDGQRSVSEVGYLMGYVSLGQFSKIFKRHHGVLPNEVK